MNLFDSSSSWDYTQSFMYIKSKVEFSKSGKIFAFDLDGTLTTAKNGLDSKKYNEIDENNWLFLGNVKEFFKSNMGEYSIFIITNQFNISNTKKRMIESVYSELDCIPTILCANKKNEYRKPNTGFIQVIRSLLAQCDIDFNQCESWYTGDAVGSNDPFVPYRWSDTDLQFSINSGLKFIRPNDLLGHYSITPTEELVIMVGTPGSLKTTFARGLEQSLGYHRFSQDELGKKKIIDYNDQIRNLLLSGQKVVLDATHPSDNSRLPWMIMVKEINEFYGTNLRVRVLWNIRNGSPWNDLRTGSSKISHFAYVGKYGYVKNFNDPRLKQDEYKYEVSIMY